MYEYFQKEVKNDELKMLGDCPSIRTSLFHVSRSSSGHKGMHLRRAEHSMQMWKLLKLLFIHMIWKLHRKLILQIYHHSNHNFNLGMHFYQKKV